MVVGPGGGAVVYAALRVVVEHGRVGAADPGAAGAGRAAPAGCPGSDPLAGRDGGRVEPPADAVRVERQAAGPAAAGPAAAVRRVRRRYRQWLLNCSVTH